MEAGLELWGLSYAGTQVLKALTARSFDCSFDVAREF